MFIIMNKQKLENIITLQSDGAAGVGHMPVPSLFGQRMMQACLILNLGESHTIGLGFGPDDHAR